MERVNGLGPGPDGKLRCAWGLSAPEYVRYHDEEWGWPSAEEIPLFEKLCLEGFQSGLSWLTILKKREAFHEAFDGFEIRRVARFTAARRERLMKNAAIIRNRQKIEAAVENGRRIQKLQKTHGSFKSWLDAQHPLTKAEWVKLFKSHFVFTGGEITGEFLLSTGYLPGAHVEHCPVYAKILVARPPWLVR